MSKRQSVLLTTSRRPTVNIRTLCRDLSYVFPNVMRINRGKSSLEEVMEKAIEFNVEKLIIVDRWEKGFGKIEFFVFRRGSLRKVLPIVYLRNVKFRRNFEWQMPREEKMKSVLIATVSKEDFEIKKFEDFLASFFNVPALSLEDSLNSNCDVLMQILVNHPKQMAIAFKLIPELVEVGPRMEIAHLAWEATQ